MDVSDKMASLQVEDQEDSDPRDFTVIENPLFSKSKITTSDICKYIADMADELGAAAMNANEEMLALFLNTAAAEAHRQASRLCRLGV